MSGSCHLIRTVNASILVKHKSACFMNSILFSSFISLFVCNGIVHYVALSNSRHCICNFKSSLHTLNLIKCVVCNGFVYYVAHSNSRHCIYNFKGSLHTLNLIRCDAMSLETFEKGKDNSWTNGQKCQVHTHSIKNFDFLKRKK